MRSKGRLFFRKSEDNAELPMKEQTIKNVKVSIELVEVDGEVHMQFTCPVCHNLLALPTESIVELLNKQALPDRSREYIRRGTR